MKLLLAPLAWLWLQGSGLEVRVFADETRISVGDDLVLTIQATARDMSGAGLAAAKEPAR